MSNSTKGKEDQQRYVICICSSFTEAGLVRVWVLLSNRSADSNETLFAVHINPIQPQKSTFDNISLYKNLVTSEAFT